MKTVRYRLSFAALCVIGALAACTAPKHTQDYYLKHDAERKAELARCGGTTTDAECVAAMQAQTIKDQTNPAEAHALDHKL